MSYTDHQHHRRPQRLRQLRRGGQFTLAGRTVVQPHHALDHGQVGPGRAVREERAEQLGAAEV
ncbi:hypothetical protein, partial [Isoptericola sp. NPDC060257]|uniref:hypothetical protein n=1 Tax=Isoptericola sp. NPDC060257 TaxID=3347087 RepID=UPI0036599E1F